MQYLRNLFILVGFVSIIFLTGCEARLTSPLQGAYYPNAPVVMPIAQPIPRHHPAWQRDSGRPGPHILSPIRMNWPSNRPSRIHMH